MNKYYALNNEQQRIVITQVSNKTGLPVQAIEKDLWVTTMLQIVFSLPIAPHLIFKGGTSLSKVWNVIQRFSEDIDLAINHLWGFEGDLTKKQVKLLRKTSSIFVRDELCEAIKTKVEEMGLSSLMTIEADPDGEGDNTYPEPRVIHIRYHSLFENELPYLHSEVKLEVGSRSLIEPTNKAKVSSLIQQNVPIETTVVDIEIPTAIAEKTFFEKAFLLHELFSTERVWDADRKSRHLYDLAMMMNTEIATNAIKRNELWNTIHHHRETLTSMNGVDYTPDIRKRICLVPPISMISSWKKDYNEMCSSMIYGEKPTFDQVIEQMQKLEMIFKEFDLN